MVSLWLSIRVDLVDGPSAPALWPRPGRVLVVGPDMTFRTLADAIETAFARWGPPGPQAFTFADGRRLARGDAATVRLDRLAHGERFAYEQDPGAGWSHLCTVDPAPVDPLALLGRPPDGPTVVDGWGALPDPHGRAWHDDATAPDADRPIPPLGDLPDLLPWWGAGAERSASPDDTAADGPGAHGPPSGAADPWEALQDQPWHAPWDEPWDEPGLTRLRAAIAQDDLVTVAALFAEYDETDVVHQVGPTLARAAASGDPNAREALRPLLILLDERDWPGDVELADELQVALAVGVGGAPPGATEASRRALTPTPVDLATLAAVLDGPADPAFTWRLEVRTGRLIPPRTADGPSGTPDPEDVPVVGAGPRAQLDDLVAFIDLGADTRTAGLLAAAPRELWARIQEDLQRDPDHHQRWMLFAQERRLGRARRWLTEHGLRPRTAWDDDADEGADEGG